jgi:ABC-type nitrate/sulfonate/bicarbonate transport system substrate-binding protein
MTNLRIGGVPEHFNYPWYLTLKNKEYTKHNINLRWTDFPGGTGQMCSALRNDEVDIAIILTEGIIKDIGEGNPSKIVQTFVKSPLIWGIHVAYNSPYTKVEELENATIAISRYGSGSHLMAIVNAYNLGWDISKLKFKVVGDLQGGIDALTNGVAHYFMWEHFTTKPLVDNQTFKRLGDCPTPWSCFVIAVREEILKKYPQEIKDILETINTKTSDFKQIQGIDTVLSKRYEQQLTDIQQWLSLTEWESKNPISKEFIENVQNKLMDFGVIEKQFDAEKFIKNMYI